METITYTTSDINMLHDWEFSDIDAGRYDDISNIHQSEIDSFHSIRNTLKEKDDGLSEDYIDFCADVINGLAQTFKEVDQEAIPLTIEQVELLNTVLFKGGMVDWIGKNVRVRPLMADFIRERIEKSNIINSGELGRAVCRLIQQDETEGIPMLFGNNSKHDMRRSAFGRLLFAQLDSRPFMADIEYDIDDAEEEFIKNGVILRGAVDQFVQSGDGETIVKYFAKLKLLESQPALDTIASGNSCMKILQDNSKYNEKIESNGAISIKYNSQKDISVADALLGFDDDRVGRVVAGYESYKHVPYLPIWMLDSEYADMPCTLILDVYKNGYSLLIQE